MKEIDIAKALKEKSPKIYNFLPGFVIRYLKRIIHQDEINDFIKEYGDETGNEFTHDILKRLQITYNVDFEVPVDKTKRYILTSNHPLGGPDGIVLIDYFSRYFDKIIFPVNDILMQVENLSDFFIPINKHGSQSREGARLMEEALASDAQILMFPAGLVSRKKKGVIKDLQWQKHFIAKAKKHERDVLPIYFSGRNSNFFYNLANIRTFLGIKLNIEMLYLGNELFKQQGQNFTIKVGKPIKHNTFDNSKRLDEWASFVKETVYNLE